MPLHFCSWFESFEGLKDLKGLGKALVSYMLRCTLWNGWLKKTYTLRWSKAAKNPWDGLQLPSCRCLLRRLFWKKLGWLGCSRSEQCSRLRTRSAREWSTGFNSKKLPRLFENCYVFPCLSFCIVITMISSFCWQHKSTKKHPSFSHRKSRINKYQ